jgi:hypothetical protein
MRIAAAKWLEVSTDSTIMGVWAGDCVAGAGPAFF